MPFMQSLLSSAAQGGGGTDQIMIVEATRSSVGGKYEPNVKYILFFFIPKLAISIGEYHYEEKRICRV